MTEVSRRRDHALSACLAAAFAGFYGWTAATSPFGPQRIPALIFASGGFLAAAGLWLSLRRRYFPDSGAIALAAGLAILGMATMSSIALREPVAAGTSLAAGYGCSMLGLLCLFLGLHARNCAGWLAAAGACLGVAAIARPVYAAGAVALLFPLRWGWWRSRRDGGWGLLAMAAAFAAALFVCRGGGLPQFDRLEFNAGEFKFHAFAEYLVLPRWSRYFPFVEPCLLAPHGGSQSPIETPGGLLAIFPFLWLALLAPLAVWRRQPNEGPGLGAFLNAAAVFHIAVGFVVIGFGRVGMAGLVDLAPSLALLACAGLLAVERAAPAGAVRSLIRVLGGAAAVYCAWIALMLNVQCDGALRQEAPELYRRIAHAFDEPIYAVERMVGVRYGPLDLILRFPRHAAHPIEPILATGLEPRSDQLLVRYLDERQIQVGFAHEGLFTAWSSPVPIDTDAVHRLWVQMGGLFPPREHPVFDRVGRAAADRFAGRLQVVLDGRTLFDLPQEFFDASPGSTHIGWGPSLSPDNSFTGQIYGAQRSAWTETADELGAFGPMRVELDFPAIPPSAGLPLLSAGAPGSGGVLFVRFTGPGQAHFGFDQWGAGLFESSEVRIEPGSVHRIGLRLPALQPLAATPAARALRSSLAVDLDGAPIWVCRIPADPHQPDQVYIGWNGIGATSCQKAFPGSIRSVERILPEAQNASNARGPVRLRLQWPRGRAGRSEPLVVTGAAGRADLLSVRYLDAGRVRFALDHWGRSYLESAPIATDFDRIHVLEIALPTLDWPEPADGGEFNGKIEIMLDGAVAWSAPSSFFRVSPSTLSIAENRIGGSCDEAFTGGIMSVERPAALPSGD